MCDLALLPSRVSDSAVANRTWPADTRVASRVDGDGLDGAAGMYFANAGEDVHAVGSLAPLAPVVGCIA